MNNNRYLSPMGVILLVIGIFVAAVVPPAGIIIIVGALGAQSSFRRRYRRAHAAEVAKAREKLRREKILAAKSLP